MPSSTPIGTMSNLEARRALGPSLALVDEAKIKLPKTPEAASRVPDAEIVRLTNAWLVRASNVAMLIEQIEQTERSET